MGRKPKTDVEKFARRQLTLPPELDARIEALALVRGISVSALIRTLIERELDDSTRAIDVLAGEGARKALEAAGYEIRKIIRSE